VHIHLHNSQKSLAIFVFLVFKDLADVYSAFVSFSCGGFPFFILLFVLRTNGFGPAFFSEFFLTVFLFASRLPTNFSFLSFPCFRGCPNRHDDGTTLFPLACPFYTLCKEHFGIQKYYYLKYVKIPKEYKIISSHLKSRHSHNINIYNNNIR